MPIFVEEVVISVEVTGEKEPAQKAAPKGEASVNEKAIIEVCVERVLEILERRKEP
jgi:hypothetical protein